MTVGHGQSALAADRDGVWAANRQDGTLSLISADNERRGRHVHAPGARPTSACSTATSGSPAPAPGAVLRSDPDTQPQAPPSPSAPTRRRWRAARAACGRSATAGGWHRSARRRTRCGSTRRRRRRSLGPRRRRRGAVGREPAHRHGLARRSRARRRHGDRAAPTGRRAGGAGRRRRRRLGRQPPGADAGADRSRSAPSSPTGCPSAASRARSPSWTAASGWRSPPRGPAIAAARCASTSGRGGRPIATPGPSSTRRPATPRSRRLLSLTNDGLTAFRRVGGTAGTELVPDLAEAIPTPSDGGRTYTFTVRDGVRFSTGQPVRPSDVKRGIERSLNAEQAAFGLLDGIASIAADDANRTIVIRLRRPDPDFLYRLALPFASAVPPGTRAAAEHRAGHGALPDRAVGPRRRVRLERNRFYRTWSAAREAGRLSGRHRRPAGRQRAQGASRPSAPAAPTVTFMPTGARRARRAATA